MGQAAAAEVQQLEHLVEGGRVAAVGGADREEPFQVPRDEIAREQRLPGVHPVAVPAEGVDLAVVRHEAVGVRERPRRERVGREPTVHQGQSAVEALVGQVGVELDELVACEHPLVHQGAGRQGRHVGPVDLVLDPLAHAERHPVEHEGLGVGQRAVSPGGPVGGGQHHLADPRHGPQRGRPQARRLRGHGAPAEHPQALLEGELLHPALDLGGVVGVGRQEEGAGRVPTGFGQVEGDRRRQEAVRELDQDARTVPRRHLGAGGAPVRQVLERRQGLADEPVAAATLEVGHERDPARVVLERRVVEGAPMARGWVGCAGSLMVVARDAPWSRHENGFVCRPGRRWPTCSPPRIHPVSRPPRHHRR